jgi:hypothetical protein
MKQLFTLLSLSALFAISSASAVTFINLSGERVILRDFSFTHNREIGLKPIILQNDSYYENSEIKSCVMDLKTESLSLGALKPECSVLIETEEVRVDYPLGEAKKGILDGTWEHLTVQWMKKMEQDKMQK